MILKQYVFLRMADGDGFSDEYNNGGWKNFPQTHQSKMYTEVIDI